jgi:hypothetical protein
MIPQLINLLIYLVVIGVVLALVLYVIDAVPLPDPMGRVIKVVAIVICALIVILLLLQLVGVARVDMLPLERP